MYVYNRRVYTKMRRNIYIYIYPDNIGMKFD